MEELHENEFETTDCLKCANCCKTTGPLFTNADVERIAKYFRQKPQKFIAEYLKIDEDNDYVLQQVPCAFLGKAFIISSIVTLSKDLMLFRRDLYSILQIFYQSLGLTPFVSQ